MEPKDYYSKWKEEIEKFGKAFCIGKKCCITDTDVVAMSNHIQVCSNVPYPGYHCTKCNRYSHEKETSVIRHIEIKHMHKNVIDTANCDGEIFSPDASSFSGDDDRSFSISEIDENTQTKKKFKTVTARANIQFDAKYKRCEFKNRNKCRNKIFNYFTLLVFTERSSAITQICYQRMKFL